MKNIFLKILVFLILILNIYKISFSQKNFISEDVHFRANYQYGFLLPEYDFLEYLTNENIKAYEVDFYKELSGNKLWERLYKYPSIGVSFFYTSLGNKDVFGNAFAFNPYIKFNLLKKTKFQLEYSIGTGITYVSKHFDFQRNYQNIAVGSHINIWLNSELTASFRVFNNVSIIAGTAFNHLSNANLAEPNIGLNTWTFFTGTDIKIGKAKEKNIQEIPKFQKKNQYAVILALGSKKTRRFGNKYYFASSLSFEYKRITGYKFAIGGGADVFYDASIPDEMRRAKIEDIKNLYKFKSGLHISQEFIFGKISLIFQEGLHLILTDKLNNHKMYNRGILRYKISNHIFVNLTMKSNLVVLDVMEAGVGYYWH